MNVLARNLSTPFIKKFMTIFDRSKIVHDYLKKKSWLEKDEIKFCDNKQKSKNSS